MQAFIDATHLHVSETSDKAGGKVQITLHVLTPETPATKNPHPQAKQFFPGYRSLGHVQVVVDAATAAGIARGTKFAMKPHTP